MESYIAECRAIAERDYCYADLIEDCENLVIGFYEEGKSAQECVDYLGEKYDLIRFD